MYYSKKIVYITLTQIHGMKHELFKLGVVLILLTSCSSYHPSSKKNFINKDEYYNSATKIYASLFGDINRIPLNRINKKKLKSKITKFPGVSLNKLIFAGTTFAPPHYEMFVFLKNKPKNTRKKLIVDNQNNTVIGSKLLFDKEVIIALISKDSASMTALKNDGLSMLNSINVEGIKNKLSYMHVFEKYRQENNYLLTIDKIQNAPIENSSDREKWIQFQIVITLQSFINENPEYKSMLDSYEASRKEYLKKTLMSDLIKREALKNDQVIEKIEKLSQDTRIVILNENHWYPKHRIAAKKLLSPLKRQGYTHLAVEAVNKEKENELNLRRYPVKSTGYYTQEPFFGQLLREAMKMGFTIVGYDESETDNRERSQAQNIKVILDQNAKAKVFIYVGVDHVLEEGRKNKRMAYYLKNMTGIDPLTINQTELPIPGEGEIILLPSKNFKDVPSIKTSTDYLLINNLSASFKDYFNTKKNIEIPLETTKRIKGEKILVSVYLNDEYKKHRTNAVPILNKTLYPEGGRILLELPEDVFWITVLDDKGGLFFSDKVMVHSD